MYEEKFFKEKQAINLICTYVVTFLLSVIFSSKNKAPKTIKKVTPNCNSLMARTTRNTKKYTIFTKRSSVTFNPSAVCSSFERALVKLFHKADTKSKLTFPVSAHLWGFDGPEVLTQTKFFFFFLHNPLIVASLIIWVSWHFPWEHIPHLNSTTSFSSNLLVQT